MPDRTELIAMLRDGIAHAEDGQSESFEILASDARDILRELQPPEPLPEVHINTRGCEPMQPETAEALGRACKLVHEQLSTPPASPNAAAVRELDVVTMMGEVWSALRYGLSRYRDIVAIAVCEDYERESARFDALASKLADVLNPVLCAMADENRTLAAECERLKEENLKLKIGYVSASEGWPGVKAAVDDMKADRDRLAAEVERLRHGIYELHGGSKNGCYCDICKKYDAALAPECERWRAEAESNRQIGHDIAACAEQADQQAKADRDRLAAELDQMTMWKEGERKAKELLLKGMESQAEIGDGLKHENRRLAAELASAELKIVWLHARTTIGNCICEICERTRAALAPARVTDAAEGGK